MDKQTKRSIRRQKLIAIVGQFNVKDLKSVLSQLNVSTKGKKAILYDRVCDLIRNPPEKHVSKSVRKYIKRLQEENPKYKLKDKSKKQKSDPTIDSTIDSIIDTRIDSRVDSRIDSTIDPIIDSIIGSGIDSRINSNETDFQLIQSSNLCTYNGITDNGINDNDYNGINGINVPQTTNSFSPVTNASNSFSSQNNVIPNNPQNLQNNERFDPATNNILSHETHANVWPNVYAQSTAQSVHNQSSFPHVPNANFMPHRFLNMHLNNNFMPTTSFTQPNIRPNNIPSQHNYNADPYRNNIRPHFMNAGTTIPQYNNSQQQITNSHPSMSLNYRPLNPNFPVNSILERNQVLPVTQNPIYQYFKPQPNINRIPQENANDVRGTIDSLLVEQNSLLPDSCKSDNIIIQEYRFKNLRKYNKIQEIHKPEIIHQLSDLPLEAFINLSVHVPKFNSWLDANVIQENCLQVQLRFCFLLDLEQKERKDCAPEYLCISLNGMRVYRNSEDGDFLHPLNITSFCKFGCTNKLMFWLEKENNTWIIPCMFEVALVSVTSSEKFLLSLNETILEPEYTKEIIRKRLESSSDNSMTVSVMDTKVSLICPIKMNRIEIPCRTSFCKHIECFDAITFLNVNESKYDWFCPICSEPASYDSLRIDGYFMDILKSVDPLCDFVKIDKNGYWNTTEKLNGRVCDIIELDSDDFRISDIIIIDD